MSKKKRVSLPTFKRAYLVDTSVILSDVQNLRKLSDNKQNLVVVTETVLQEVDKYKVGSEPINYQAREFNRLLSSCKVIRKYKSGALLENGTIFIFLVDESELKGERFEVNDDRIIESYLKFFKRARKLSFFKGTQVKFISNDSLFRIKVELKGYESEPLFSEQYSFPESFFLKATVPAVLPNKTYFKVDELNSYLQEGKEIEPYHSTLELRDKTGNPFYFVRLDRTTFKRIDNRESLNLFGFSPRNLEQRLLWNLLLTKTDILVIEGIAGTSKTLSTLLCALRDIQLGKYHSITYLRKTIISGDRQDDLGFLPGDLKAKLSGYLWPLRDNIEQIVRKRELKKLKKKKKGKEQNQVALSQKEIEELVTEFEDKWNIRYEYLGHLRGRNLEGIIIIDEAQNFSIKDIVTILSRVVDGSKVFVLGSLKQIDNPRLNKNNNALAFLLSKCGTFENGVSIQGMRLSSVLRGKICNWIEQVTKKP